jgi:DNA repair protein RadD
MFKLRDYQSKGIKEGIDHCKSSNEPVIFSYSVGSGKTVIIKEICKHVISKGGQCLSLAHTVELLDGAAKTFGNGCCIYSAGFGKKELNQKMIYGGEKSIANALHKLPKIDLLCLDECDRLNDDKPESSYMKIVTHILKVNPKCRILGFTGTPERMGTGAIYGKKRFFKKIISEVTAGYLLKLEYLTQPITTEIDADKYDFEAKTIYTNKYLESVVKSKHRLTKHIVDDITLKTENRNKVLIFASTIQHCDEILSHFPDNNALILSSKLTKHQRKDVLNSFHYGNCKYLINRDILTVGYDFPEIDALALLRPTESKRLLIQILGRSMRLHESKKNSLILDYAGNLDRHGSLDYLFSGEVAKVKNKHKQNDEEPIQCPQCGKHNKSTARKCTCGFYFISKVCPDCDHEQDITVRYCQSCGIEIVNPNDSLFALANDGSEIFRAKVLNTNLSKHTKGTNPPCLLISIMTNDKLNNFPMISTFMAEGSGFLKHWIKSHIKDGIAPEPFYDSVDMIIKYQSDFVMDEIVSYKKDGKYFKLLKE